MHTDQVVPVQKDFVQIALVGNKQTVTSPCYHAPFPSHFFESYLTLSVPKLTEDLTKKSYLPPETKQLTYGGREAPE